MFFCSSPHSPAAFFAVVTLGVIENLPSSSLPRAPLSILPSPLELGRMKKSRPAGRPALRNMLLKFQSCFVINHALGHACEHSRTLSPFAYIHIHTRSSHIFQFR